jgi:hypothetical protein
MGPLLRIYTSFDTSKLFNQSSKFILYVSLAYLLMILPDPSLFYSPSSGSTSLFGAEHAADARSQIGDFPPAFKALDGKLLGEEHLIPIFSTFADNSTIEEVLNPALPSWPSNPVFDSTVYNHPNLGPSRSFNDMRINDGHYHNFQPMVHVSFMSFC